MDPRSKALSVIILNAAIFNANFISLFAFLIFFILLLKSVGISIGSVILKTRSFLILLALVFVARSFSTPGDPFLEINFIKLTREGMRDGALLAWRILLIVVTGILFSSTTKTSEIKAVVEWFLRPISFIPEKKASLMMSLLFRFVPVIFEQANEISAAQRARCIEKRKNPLYKAKKMCVPLILKTFKNADNLAEAMEARLYSEDRAPHHFRRPGKDFLIPLALLFISAAIAAEKYFLFI